MPDPAAKATVEADLLSSLVNSLALERVANGETEILPAHMPRALDVAGSDRALMVHQSLGGRVFDADGTSYVDLCMGHGALMLGHGAAPVKAALQRQLELGGCMVSRTMSASNSPSLFTTQLRATSA